jgi:hypothetical protein
MMLGLLWPILLWALQPVTAGLGGIIAFRGLRFGHDPILLRTAKLVVAVPPLLSISFGALMVSFDREVITDALFSFPTLCSVVAMTAIIVGEKYRLRVGPPDDRSLRLR